MSQSDSRSIGNAVEVSNQLLHNKYPGLWIDLSRLYTAYILDMRYYYLDLNVLSYCFYDEKHKLFGIYYLLFTFDAYDRLYPQ